MDFYYLKSSKLENCYEGGEVGVIKQIRGPPQSR